MREEIDLVSLPKKSFWKLSLPIMFFCIFDAIYGIVDMVWVSQISVEAFFAMGVSIPIVSLIFSFGDSLGQGTNSIMSRFIGSGDYESAYNALIHGMILSNVIWVIIVLCALFANGILFYIDQSESYILIFDYLIPIVVFAYIFIFVNLFSETLQAEGNSRTPTILIIGSNILNIILDPIFIFNLNMGIKGAAYATVISAFIPFICLLYLYLSGRTKVPLSPKYLKIRRYIFIEIFKVALPNFLDDGLWCLSASFMNSILIVTMGATGPILYSIANKLKTLLIAPVRSYGRALMSVTGHLFGAHKFDDLKKMFIFALKASLVTTFVIMVVFIFIREYAFSLFSITGMETEIFWIAIGGTVIMLSVPFSMIASKMLDGFGKSMYSLALTAAKVIFEMALIYILSTVVNDGSCVLIGIIISEILSSIAYCIFLMYLFNNFDEKYENESTVRTFLDEDESSEDSKIGKITRKVTSRPQLIIALVGIIIILLSIFNIALKSQNYTLILSGLVSLALSALSIYLMELKNRPGLSIIGSVASAVVLFAFMGKYGYLPTLLFIVVGIQILYIKLIAKKISEEDK
ncbi:MATE family efflux transporter [Methanobrevibacter sp.]|uniref:MATE family efflux transporter n=1 Tax=Methanobrevibacter sp. TaxID=66852 RepID=UPI00386AA7CE